jgi:hypothetical protein
VLRGAGTLGWPDRQRAATASRNPRRRVEDEVPPALILVLLLQGPGALRNCKTAPSSSSPQGPPLGLYPVVESLNQRCEARPVLCSSSSNCDELACLPADHNADQPLSKDQQSRPENRSSPSAHNSTLPELAPSE